MLITDKLLAVSCPKAMLAMVIRGLAMLVNKRRRITLVMLAVLEIFLDLPTLDGGFAHGR